MATDEPGIYAIGDVVALPDRPHPQLAHVASFEGIGVAERLAGHAVEALNYDRVPSATYCRPEVAGVGLTEAEAKKRGYDVRSAASTSATSRSRGSSGIRRGWSRSSRRRSTTRCWACTWWDRT